MRILFFILVSLSLSAFHPAYADEADSEAASTAHAAVSGERADLLFYAVSLIGTAYKYGGNSPQTGMDCSGFVRYVFSNVAGLHLPRSAHEISETGEQINERNLRPGDLVFFHTMKRAFSHVGIYLGEHRFIHAPSTQSSSVMISDMQDKYWAQRFEGARRLLALPLSSVR
ncbi:MAG: C40 family peptidase [Sulfuriferula sp.]